MLVYNNSYGDSMTSKMFTIAVVRRNYLNNQLLM